MEERNLSLSPRRERTRPSSHRVVKFEIDEIKQRFHESVEEIEKQCLVARELYNAEKLEQAENIWRAQIVFLESTLDFYMHEITKYGLEKMFNEEWESTKKYGSIQVKMEVVHRVIREEEDPEWFLNYINDYYREVTMVSYSSFKEQMNLLGLNLKKIADGAFHELNVTERTIDKLRRRLNELYNRRNIIAHQFDRQHTDAVKKEISEGLVMDFINDVKKIIEAVNTQVLEK